MNIAQLIGSPRREQELAVWTGYGLALLGTIVGKPRPATDNSCRTASN